jgi:flagellar biosynthesis protein FlhG
MVPNDAPAASGAKLPKAANLIAVASGKGGVGKTWLSVTLCHALSRMGRKVLLFDADLCLANVDIQLGLMPQRDLGGVLSGRLTLAQAKVRYDDGKFDIIAGRSGSGNLAQLPSSKLASLGTDLVRLCASYDSVVMDLGAGLDRTVRMLAARAGVCLVVTTPEPTSLTDAYAFIKVVLGADSDADVRVVVNTAEGRGEGLRTYETLRKAANNFLHVSPPLAGVIRRDRKVAESIRAQIPLLTRAPTSDAGTDVERIADTLIHGDDNA